MGQASTTIHPGRHGDDTGGTDDTVISADYTAEETHELTDAEIDDIERAMRAYPPGSILAWHMMPNHTSADNKAAPEGAVVEFGESTPAYADALTYKLGHGVAISKVQGNLPHALLASIHDVAPEDAVAALHSRLLAASPEFAPGGADARPRLACHSGKGLVDKEPWEAEIGDGGSFVGVYETQTPQGRPGTRYSSRSYYLIVKAGPGTAGEDLYEKLCDRQQNGQATTMRELAASDELKYVQALGKRNRCRILAQAADALGASIRTGTDRMAAGDVKPKMAIPVCDIPSCTLRHNPRGESVLWFNQCADTNTATSSGFPLCIYPTAGVAVYHAAAGERGVSVADGFGPDISFTNGAHGALPMGTGRVRAVRHAFSKGGKILDYRNKTLVEDDAGYEKHSSARVVRTPPSDGRDDGCVVARANDKLLSVYRDRDKRFCQVEERLGVVPNTHAISTLNPIIVRIGSTPSHRLPD